SLNTRMHTLATLLLCLQLPVSADTLSMDKGGKTMTYEVVKGDTLWDLSDDFYDDPLKYPEIWKANPFIKDPHWIYPGQVLSIPGGRERGPAAAAPAAMTPPPPPPPPGGALEAAPAPAPVVTEAAPAPKPAMTPVVPVPAPKVAVAAKPEKPYAPMLN